jgi:hypothetical protein
LEIGDWNNGDFCDAIRIGLYVGLGVGYFAALWVPMLTLPAFKRKMLALRHPIPAAAADVETVGMTSTAARDTSTSTPSLAVPSTTMETAASLNRAAAAIRKPYDHKRSVAAEIGDIGIGFAVKYTGVVISFTAWLFIIVWIVATLIAFLCAYPPFWDWFWEIREWWIGYIACT